MNINKIKFKPVNNKIVFKFECMYGESLESDLLEYDKKRLKNWNDLVIGEIVEVGDEVVNFKVGEKISVMLSLCLGMIDLFENEKLLDNEIKDYYMIPENLITSKIL